MFLALMEIDGTNSVCPIVFVSLGAKVTITMFVVMLMTTALSKWFGWKHYCLHPCLQCCRTNSQRVSWCRENTLKFGFVGGTLVITYPFFPNVCKTFQNHEGPLSSFCSQCFYPLQTSYRANGAILEPVCCFVYFQCFLNWLMNRTTCEKPVQAIIVALFGTEGPSPYRLD